MDPVSRLKSPSLFDEEEQSVRIAKSLSCTLLGSWYVMSREIRALQYPVNEIQRAYLRDIIQETSCYCTLRLIHCSKIFPQSISSLDTPSNQSPVISPLWPQPHHSYPSCNPPSPACTPDHCIPKS